MVRVFANGAGDLGSIPGRVIILYLPNPSARAGYDTRSIFKQSLRGFNSEFSFLTSCLTKAEKPCLPYYLPIARGRIIRFIPFPRVLVLCEMQSVSSRIRTRVAVSISYDDNHYTTGTSKTQKMVLDVALLNTQHYKIRIKGKVKQSSTPWCSSYRKGRLRVPLDYGRQLYFYFLFNNSHLFINIVSSN